MKALWFTAMTSSQDLIAVVPAERIVERGTLRDADPLPRPFITYTISTVTRTGHNTASSFVEVFVYDDIGTYDRIHDIIRRLRGYLESMPAISRTREDGSKVLLSYASWQGQGPELSDPVLEAAYCSSSWQLIGTGQ